jgi:hypothetical protein
VRHGTGGIGVKALGSALSERAVAALDQGEEPAAPCVQPSDGGQGVNEVKYVDRLENFRPDIDDAAICNSQVASRRKREIEDAITNEWAAVGDADDD